MDSVEKTINEVGEVLSQPFHDRVRVLIKKLSKFKGVEIDHLIMGMGSYVLSIKAPWRETFKGKTEEGIHDMNIGDFNDSRNQPIETYECVNPGIAAVAQEIDDILMFLTDKHYLSIFDINEEEMKKLLDNV